MKYMPAELDAVWAYVHSLQSRHSLSEEAAIERALEDLDREGRPLDVATLKAHRPSKRGHDTHTDDIGREIMERGLEWSGPCETDDVQAWADHHIAQLQEHPEAYAALRERIGVTVIGALFRRIIPNLPERKWEKRRSWRTVDKDATVVHLRPLMAGGRINPHDHQSPSAELLIGRTMDGLMVADQLGQIHALRKGCIAIYDGKGALIEVMLECTMKAIARKSFCKPMMHYYQWGRWGAGNWDQSFRKFVAWASLYSPGEMNALTGSGIASLLGETRAALSLRKQKELTAYREATGGRAGFAGMRTTKDPRKGRVKEKQAVI